MLLTGTPLQNNLTELFMLMHFLDQGKFEDPDAFEAQFAEISQDGQVLLASSILTYLRMFRPVPIYMAFNASTCMLRLAWLRPCPQQLPKAACMWSWDAAQLPGLPGLWAVVHTGASGQGVPCRCMQSREAGLDWASQGTACWACCSIHRASATSQRRRTAADRAARMCATEPAEACSASSDRFCI